MMAQDFKTGLRMVIAMVVGIAALLYIFWGNDLIPERLAIVGPQAIMGFLDDAIILIGALIVFRRLKVVAFPPGKSKTNWFFAGGFVLLLGGVLFYVFWGADLLPDGLPWIGFFDDIAVVIGSMGIMHKYRSWFKSR